MRILLVQIRHRMDKPSVHHDTFVVIRHIRVEIRLFIVVRLDIMVQIVKPIVAGDILHPWMFTTAMVEDHIHHDFHSSLVSLVYKSFIILIGSKAGIHTVVVCRCITMV